eukprot:1158314-Pelagomonas_calceolata.AAC.8
MRACMYTGRQLMGENTYNHVYGNGTTGDITKAFRTNQGLAVGSLLDALSQRTQRRVPWIPPLCILVGIQLKLLLQCN